MNKKAMEFRNRNKKVAAMQAEADAQAQTQAGIQQMIALVIGLNKRVVDLERSNRVMYPAALDGEMRSAAIARLLTKLGIAESEVQDTMRLIYIEDFEKGDPNDDSLRGLEPAAADTAAANGHFAVLNLKLFKDGKELPEGEVVRRKIELGKQEAFPELDDLVVGMKVGDTKRVPFAIGTESDEMEITLLKLRQKKVTKEESNAEVAAQPSS